ncbi:MAG: universal stress protein [Candidatus Thermoplasmatota archaeon]|jgi:nucleotide-binding universal stress UspA family protein
MAVKPKSLKAAPAPSPPSGGRVAGKRHSLLLAVDFSKASRIALEAARAMAKDLGADIVLLHASSPAPPPIPFSHDRETETLAAGRIAAGDAARLSSEWAEELRGDGIRVQVVNPIGPPVKEILAEAETRNSRAIIVGTTGRTGLKDWVLGSVAREVLRRSKVPVLVAPLRMQVDKSGAPVASASKTILVGVDFSTESEAAYEAALRLAHDLKARLHVLHVTELATANVPFPLGAEISVELMEADEERAATNIAELASKARALKVGVNPSLGLGHPASVILAEARQTGASLIIVGTHGKSAARRFLLGSVAEQVVQLSDRPVLVIPDPKGREPGDLMRSDAGAKAKASSSTGRRAPKPSKP